MLVPSASMRELLKTAVQEYQRQLPGSPAEEYLKVRGITKETQDYFQIGFVGEALKGDDHLKNRLCIPYLTPAGPVVLKFRALDEREPRFLYRSGSHAQRLFNTSVLRQPHKTIYLCEGEFDTLTAYQCGLPVVGLPGCKNWIKLFARIFRGRHVVVLADGDDAGEGLKFAEQVCEDVESGGIILFEGSDVNRYFTDYGQESLLKKVGYER